MSQYQLFEIDSPIGVLRYICDEQATVHLLAFADQWEESAAYIQKYLASAPAEVSLAAGPHDAALANYFGGDIAAIDAIPVAVQGTKFQMAAWWALREIPAGETWSYLEQATFVGSAKAVRAIGMANGANPVPVILPCHRVIGKSKKLTGYGGGVYRKEWLLRHEGAAFKA